MLVQVKQRVREAIAYLQLPPEAKRRRREDQFDELPVAPSHDAAIEAAIAWIFRAQDNSPSRDGGVARDFDLLRGWSSSYPETTGYIVPTLLDYARWRNSGEARERAGRMLDWLVSIQFDSGAFQGGKIDAPVKVPVTFNTGQILIGLACGASEFGEAYRQPMQKAADWLRDTMDPDGCWRQFPTPFAQPGEKAYETHVAWGLYEAARLAPDSGYQEAADRNVSWAIGKMRDNGWCDDCCLDQPAHPLTHTLGYFLRGLLEAYRFNGAPDVLSAARTLGDRLRACQRPDGSLPGRLSADWSAPVSWSCLTGNVQIAHAWLILFCETKDTAYLDSAIAANYFVRSTLRLDGADGERGGIRGSYPIDGDYGKWQYLNWAAKFFVDSHMLELTLAEA